MCVRDKSNKVERKNIRFCLQLKIDKSLSSEPRTDLSEVSVYGYDYDYTLASYKKGVEYLIHDIAKQHLVR